MIIIKPMHGSKSYHKSLLLELFMLCLNGYMRFKNVVRMIGEKTQKSKIREVLFINVSYLYMIRKPYVLCSNLYKFW